MKRGEVWWHEPPDEKPRPVLVLTRDDVISRALDVVAMPASRTAHDWLTEVEVGPEDGMPTTSFLVAENTLSAERWGRRRAVADPRSEACSASHCISKDERLPTGKVGMGVGTDQAPVFLAGGLAEAPAAQATSRERARQDLNL